MFEKSFRKDEDKVEIVGIDHEAMAKAYEEMGEINLSIANEDYHLETESTYTVENFIKG